MRWRRPLLIAALLLLAGAVVNVAVAWGIAADIRLLPSSPFVVRPPFSDFELAMMGAEWSDSPPFHVGLRRRGAGWAIDHAMCSGGWAFAYQESGTTEVPDGDAESYSWSLAAGWPWIALRIAEQHGPEARASMPLLAAGVRVPRPRGSNWLALTDGRAPIDPIFPGFLLNTLFYATVLGVILALPLSFFPLRRRRRRARRGRCAKCNYDLAGLDGPCPECGALPRARSAARDAGESA